PNIEFTRRGILPGHVIAASNLLYGDRRPTRPGIYGHRSAEAAQLRSRTAVEEVIVAGLHQAGRAERLDRCSGSADRTVTIQILNEGSLQRLQLLVVRRGPRNEKPFHTRRSSDLPNIEFTRRGILPGHVIAASNLLYGDRRPTRPGIY